MLFDYTGNIGRRWLRLFPYTRTVLIAFGASWLGVALTIPLAATPTSRNDLALDRADAVQNHLAVTGLGLVIVGAQLFVSTLAAPRRRSSPTTSALARPARATRDAAWQRRRALSGGPRRRRTARTGGPDRRRSLRRLAEQRRGAPQRATSQSARFGDFGCGFDGHASPGRSSIAPQCRALVDVALAADLKRAPQGHRDRGHAARRAADDRVRVARRDAVPLGARAPVGARGGAARAAPRHRGRRASCSSTSRRGAGKRALELVGVPPRVSPAEEMDDHKWYFDPRDLWPLLVDAGFRPSDIRCRRHKFGLNTFAACRVRVAGARRWMTFSRDVPRGDRRDPRGRSTPTRSTGVAAGLAAVRAVAADASSCSASAVPPATRPTRSTTSASCAAFEAYAPTDNVSELTARTNDEGWDTTFSRLARGLTTRRSATRVLVFSVGGGDADATSRRQPRPRASSSAARSARPCTASSGATAATPREVGRRVRGHPAAARRAHHAAHRGALRGRVAPARQPPGARSGRRRSGRRTPLSIGRRGQRAPRIAGVVVVGGAGFIGGHLVARLLADPRSSRRHRLRQLLARAGAGTRAVARRPTARRSSRARSSDLEPWSTAAERPRRRRPPRVQPRHRPRDDRADHRLRSGHAPHPLVVEAARRTDGRRDPLRVGQRRLRRPRRASRRDEDHGPLVPVSTYGASKLAGEALISSYCLHVRALAAARSASATSSARARRTASGFDFVRAPARRPDAPPRSSATARRASPTSTSTTCSRRCCWRRATRAPIRSQVFNVATGDYITVPEIADLALECLGLDPSAVRYEYTGGDRGWKGDVPVVRLSTERVRSFGWAPTRSSREALRRVDGRARRRRPRRPPLSTVADAGRCSSTATASSCARASWTDGRTPSATSASLQLERGARRCVRRAPRRRVRPRGRHEPAGDRPGNARRARRSTRSTSAWQSFLPLDDIVICPHDDARRMRLPQAAAGHAARRRSAARDRPRGQLCDRRPLARRRGRKTRRVHHCLPGPGVQ